MYVTEDNEDNNLGLKFMLFYDLCWIDENNSGNNIFRCPEFSKAN